MNVITRIVVRLLLLQEVVSLQQGTKFDLTLSHEACDNDEYLVTDVAAPVGVCAASKNVLTYTPPFDFIGRVVVAYKTTVKGQEPEDQTLLIDVTEAPKPEVARLSVPQGATVKIALTAEGCDDDEFDVEEATAELGACSLEKNVLTFTSPADKLGDVLLTYRGRVKGGPPQVREIVVTVTEAQATLETTAETIVTTRTRMTTTVKTTFEIPHVDDHDAHIEWATVMAQLVDDASAEAPSKAALITALQDNPHADDAFLKAHKIHPDSKMATIKKKVTIKSLAIALRAFGTKVEGVKADSGALAPVSDGEADALYDMCTEDEKTDMVKFDALIKAGIDVRYKVRRN